MEEAIKLINSLWTEKLKLTMESKDLREQLLKLENDTKDMVKKSDVISYLSFINESVYVRFGKDKELKEFLGVKDGE